jgi:transposase
MWRTCKQIPTEAGRVFRFEVGQRSGLKRAEAAGLSWPLPPDLTDDVPEDRLFARAGVRRGFRRRPEPNWSALAFELKRSGVNLMVLARTNPDFSHLLVLRRLLG